MNRTELDALHGRMTAGEINKAWMERRIGWAKVSAELAAKDATEFDAWSSHGERWVNVYWCIARKDWVHWGDTGFDSGGVVSVDARLSHWMPLPEPPPC